MYRPHDGRWMWAGILLQRQAQSQCHEGFVTQINIKICQENFLELYCGTRTNNIKTAEIWTWPSLFKLMWDKTAARTTSSTYAPTSSTSSLLGCYNTSPSPAMKILDHGYDRYGNWSLSISLHLARLPYFVCSFWSSNLLAYNSKWQK